MHSQRLERIMNNELLAIGIEELLKRTTEILNNQQLIIKKLELKKKTKLSS
jgi:hypothetical protein